jgi:hypothetical protein
MMNDECGVMNKTHKQYYTEVMGLQLPAKAKVAILHIEGINYCVVWLDPPEGVLENILDGWMSRQAAEDFCRTHGYEVTKKEA